mmetsp:Transcript_7201/g.14595  ORF Transcript_7201/g.14595 Transcript_7201/m.14595 type:complete len:494 (-) Transcript_7201:73-1554(-)
MAIHRNPSLLLLLFFLLNPFLLPPTLSQPSHASYKQSHHSRTHLSSSSQLSQHQSACRERCDEVEEMYLKPARACNKWEREGRGKGTKKGKTVGETCTTSFLTQFHAMCVPTCVSYLTTASDPTLPPYTYPMPSVAKCTGLGGGAFLEGCKSGFYGSIKQTLEGLGIDGGEGVEGEKRKRKEREERKRREREEVERLKREEEERRRMEEEEEEKKVKEVEVDKSLALGLAVDAVLSADTSVPEEGIDKYSSDPARKVVKGDKVMVFYEGEGWSTGEVVKVGRGKNKKKLTILFEEEDMEDTLEYDGDYVVVVDEESAEDDSAEEMEVEEAEEAVDFTKLKVAELREECAKRDLDSKGVKAVLIKRLKEAVEGGASKRRIDDVEGDVEEAPAAKKAAVEETVDFKKLKVAELRAECTKRGLDNKGVKAVLVKRLEDSKEGGKVEDMEEGEEEGEEEVVNFKSMKVAELRAECKKRDLDTKGVKAVLLKRLMDSI